jgi:DNA gyrase subunit B
MSLEEHIIIREAVRKRPGLYFGTTGPRGLTHLIYEVIGNPIDLFLQNQVSTIDIHLTESGVTVIDDGPGFAFETIGPDGKTPFVEYHCTRYHNQPSAMGQLPHVHMTTLNGMGLASIAAASQELRIRSHRQGQLWEQRFIQGEPTGSAQILGLSQKTGSIVQVTFDQALFQESQAVFQDITPILKILQQGCLETSHLFPGLSLQLGQDKYFSKNGLLDLAQQDYPTRFNRKPFDGRVTADKFVIQAVAIGQDEGRNPCCQSWVNGARTIDDGTPVDAFRSALKRINYHPKAIYLHTILLEPEFAGPTKNRLEVPHLHSEMENRLFDALNEWLSSEY